MNREQNDISALDNSKRSLMIEFSNTKDFNKSQTNISLSEKRHATKKNYHFLNRVCCIRVNRKWMIKKQIFVTTSVVFLVVLSIVTAFIGGNIYFTRINIQDQIQAKLENRSNEDLLVFKQSFANMFLYLRESTCNNLNLINNVLNGYIDKESLSYNYNDVNNAYPININNSFYSMINPIPKDGIQVGSNFTFEYWGYASFSSSNHTYYSKEGEKYLNASSVLNYFLRDMFFWKSLPSSNYIAIYIGFLTDNLLIYYPGVQIEEWSGFDLQSRPWFNVSSLNQYSNICSLTRDYIDQATNLRISTFSLPLIDSNGKFYGVIGLDFLLEQFQSFFDEMKILDSTLIVLSVNGVVVNNAFNYLLNSTYYIYNSSITNFSMDLWLSIQDPINLEKAFRISNSQNIKYVCTVSQIFSYNTTVAFYIVFASKIEEINKYLIQLNEARDEDYWIILYVIGGTVLGLLFITIFTNICISYQIVKPLLKLTHIAEIINKIEKRTTSAEEIKRIIDFIPDDDEQISELTAIFKKVLFGIVSSKSEKVEFVLGNGKINYSVNYICGKEMKFRDKFHEIYDN